MPGMMTLPEDIAKQKHFDLIELKIDGARMTYDGMNIFSDRKIVRNDRFPHVLQELKSLPIKCRGEMAIEGGNILQLNKKVNWHRAKYFIFDLYEIKGKDVTNESIVTRREMIDELLKKYKPKNITAPIQFSSYDEGWDYVEDTKSEGLVLKEQNVCWKVKRLTEEKLPIIEHIAGKAKGAFILDRNGTRCKVSGTAIKFVEAYKILKESGAQPYAEIEYSFLTDDGIPYQPRLRRVGTLEILSS